MVNSGSLEPVSKTVGGWGGGGFRWHSELENKSRECSPPKETCPFQQDIFGSPQLYVLTSLCSDIHSPWRVFKAHEQSKYEKIKQNLGGLTLPHFQGRTMFKCSVRISSPSPHLRECVFFDIWARSPCLWCFPHCPFCLLTEAKRKEPQLITLRSNNTGYCNWSLSENTEFFLALRLPGTA